MHPYIIHRCGVSLPMHGAKEAKMTAPKLAALALGVKQVL